MKMEGGIEVNDNFFELFFEDLEFISSSESAIEKSSSEDQETSSSLEVSKKRSRVINRSQESILKRKLRRRKNFLPRILKRDIRRQLGYMIANIMNSSTKELIYKFNTTFCVPNCQLEKYSSKEIEPIIISQFPPTITSLEIPLNELWTKKIGVNSVSNFLFVSSQMSPDMVYDVNSYQIYPNNQDKSSKILIQIQVIGTIISPDIVCPTCQKIHTLNGLCKDKTVEIIGSFSSLSRIKLRGQQVIDINENNYISKISVYPISLEITKI